MISAYTEVAPEPWRIEHDLAMVCRDIEDAMELGVQLFRRLTRDEAAFQAESFRRPLGEAEMEALLDLVLVNYRRLLDSFERLLAGVETLKRHDLHPDGLDEFMCVLEEARCVVGGFEIEPEIRPIGELLTIARPENPRPDRYRD